MKIQEYDDGEILIGVFRDELIDERTYIIRGGNEAIVIDPHEDTDILNYLEGIGRVYIFLTHEHYDHISGVNRLREGYNCRVYATSVCASIIQEVNNGTSRFPFLFIGDKEKYHYVKTKIKLPYICKADIFVEKELRLRLLNKNILLWETDGHSPGGMSILINDRYLFSGDNLLGNGMEVKSIDSNPNDYKRAFDEYCKLQNKKIIVFPGHGEIDSIDNYIKKVKDYYKWS